MNSLLNMSTDKVGQAPGTLMHIGVQKADNLLIQLIDYDDSGYFQEKQVDDLAELTAAIQTPTITWINVIGLHEVDKVKDVGQAFSIHPLLLEDILNTYQRPKMDEQDGLIYLILKMLDWNEAKNEVVTEQISIILGDNFVLTFQELKRDVLTTVRKRIRERKGRMRKAGADYLAYAILDAVVDQYFFILERLGERAEEFEEELLTSPTPNTLQSVHGLKRELLFIRKSVWPLRELLSGLQHGESELIQQATLIYLRDVYEHTIQIIDTIEILRDMASTLQDTYLSSISNKMNEVMKVLTVIATLFIPITFITSLYGMNFQYMPELQWRLGYPLLWLLILIISMTLLVYFKRKNWL